MFLDREHDTWSCAERLELQESVRYLEDELDFVRQEQKNYGMSDEEKVKLRVVIQKLAGTITGLEDRLGQESAERTLTREDMQQLRDLFWSVQQKFDNYAYHHDQNARQLGELREQITDLQTKFYGSRSRMESHVYSILSAAFEAEEVATKSYIDAKFAKFERNMRESLEATSSKLLRKHQHECKNAGEACNRRPVPKLSSLSDELDNQDSTIQIQDMTQVIVSTAATHTQTCTETEPLLPRPIMIYQSKSASQQNEPASALQDMGLQPLVPVRDSRVSARRLHSMPPGPSISAPYSRTYSKSRSACNEAISLGTRGGGPKSSHMTDCSEQMQTSGQVGVVICTSKVTSGIEKPDEVGISGKPSKEFAWKCRAPKTLQHEIRCTPRSSGR